LKPANVKITPDDKVKVLDFGLAKALGPAEAGHYVRDSGGDRSVRLQADLTHSPTLSMTATEAGMLYEMLTGRRPLQGDTAPDILASVLAREPELSAVPPNLNPRLSELLRRCLDKHPKRRWQAVGDLRVELEAIAASPRSAPTPAAGVALPRPLWQRAIPVVLSAIVAAVLASAATVYLRPSQAPLVVTRFPFMLGEGQTITSATARQAVAISPDGTQMAYAANPRLYLRSMSELEARPIAAGADTGGFVTSPVFFTR
jgi:serine/threonine-protein kinase